MKKQLSNKLKSYIKKYYDKNVIVHTTDNQEIVGKFATYQRPEDNENNCWSIDIYKIGGKSAITLLDTEIVSMEEIDNQYTYVYVEYDDDIGGKLYCYKTKDNTLKKGDRVLVERQNEEVCAKVITIKKYNLNELPYPLEKTKFIKGKIEDDSNLNLEIIDCKYFYGDDVILSYTLNNAWGRFIDGFMIVDKKEYNIVLNGPFDTDNMKFTIPYEEIKKIKDILNKNNSVFNIKDIPMPSVLDGTEHEFYFATKKNIISFEAFNLWYWLEEDDVPKDVKVILSVVKEINKILKPYDLKIDLGEN